MPKRKQVGTRAESALQRVAECLYRNDSSGTYYAWVKRSGKQIKRSLRTKDRKLAERRLADFRKEIGAENADASERRQSFRALGEKWLAVASAGMKPASAERVAYCLKEVNKRFGDLRIADITRPICRDWAAKRAGEVRPSTYNKDANVLKAVLEFAVERGILIDSPAKGIPHLKVVDKPVRIPSRAEYETLVETMRSMDVRNAEAVNLVHLLAFSGMRLAEATHITWREIDFERGQFTVSGGEVGTKNREVRIVPLFPKLRDFLLNLREERQPSQSDCIMVNRTAKEAISSACKAANLQHFTHHCLRHYFVSNAIEVGVDFKTIAAWIGHKDGGLLVAKTYGHLRDSHSAAMAERMVF